MLVVTFAPVSLGALAVALGVTPAVTFVVTLGVMLVILLER